MFRMAASTTGEYYQAMVGPNGALDVVAAIVSEVNNANLGFETEFAVRMQLDWAVLYTDPAMDPFTTINPNSIRRSRCAIRATRMLPPSAPRRPARSVELRHRVRLQPGRRQRLRVVRRLSRRQGTGCGSLRHRPHAGKLHRLDPARDGAPAWRETHVQQHHRVVRQPRRVQPAERIRARKRLDDIVIFQLPALRTTSTRRSLDAGFYFHAHTFEEVISNITSGGGTCGSSQATGNTPPTVDAGSDYTIPRGTPFELTGSGSDPDGDGLLFTWEQYDVASGAAQYQHRSWRRPALPIRASHRRW